MLEDLIKNYIRGDREITFILGELILPRYIVLQKSGRQVVVDLEIKREKALINLDSDISKKFREDLEERHPGKYLREVPVPIEDKKLWNYLCKLYNVEEEKLETGYFLLDYLFLRPGLVVEIDGSLYHTTPNYDKARDSYILLKLGWRTKRLVDYSGEEDYKKFEEEYKNYPPKKIGSTFLFQDTALEYFTKKYEYTIKKIRQLLYEVPDFTVPEISIPFLRIKTLFGKIDREEQNRLCDLFYKLVRIRLRIP